MHGLHAPAALYWLLPVLDIRESIVQGKLVLRPRVEPAIHHRSVLVARDLCPPGFDGLQLDNGSIYT